MVGRVPVCYDNMACQRKHVCQHGTGCEISVGPSTSIGYELSVNKPKPLDPRVDTFTPYIMDWENSSELQNFGRFWGCMKLIEGRRTKAAKAW